MYTFTYLPTVLFNAGNEHNEIIISFWLRFFGLLVCCIYLTARFGFSYGAAAVTLIFFDFLFGFFTGETMTPVVVVEDCC